MNQKIVVLLATAAMTVSLACNAMAAFVQGDLIRVVYDTVGTKEYATDLGSWSTLTADAITGNVTVGGGGDAILLSTLGAGSWNNLVVGYYLTDATSGANRVATAGAAGGVTSANRKFTSYNGAAGLVTTNYNATAAGATSVLLNDKTSGNTYYTKLDTNGATIGEYSGWFSPTNNPGGSLSLAPLATTGYVDQTIYRWSAANLGLQGPTAGAAAFTVRTMADGSTVINSYATPEPSTYALLCISLGVVGFARKKLGKKADF